MELFEILNIISADLTNEIRSIIKAEGHVKTGLLYNSIQIEVAYVPMISKNKFVISYNAPYYWQYVDSEFQLTEMLKNSYTYSSKLEEFQNYLDGAYDVKNQTKDYLKRLLGDMVIANLNIKK